MYGYLYAVCSTRQYTDEFYAGTDGIFPSRQAAVDYILRDMEDTIEEQGDVPEDNIDRQKFSVITIGGDRFDWYIDPLYLDIDDLCAKVTRMQKERRD